MDAYGTRMNNDDWEELAVTKEELNNLTECLKKEEFRKLLIEYAEEVTDPDNRKIYEKEITQLEKERGVDVTFVNPEPGYVIKTSVNGDKKCFLNISQSDVVARPSSQISYEQGQRGLQWSIPYTLIPPRDDLDWKNVRCMVFDVVFHPDTIYLTSKSARFREIVNNTAMDGVESNFQVKLDRKNIKFPKISYKGVCHPTVVRKPSKEPAKEKLDIEPEIYQKLMASYDESRDRQSRSTVTKAKQRATPPTTYYQEKPDQADPSSTTTAYATPKFAIKHHSDIDLEDFVVGRDAKMHAAIPKKLIVTIDLPLLKTSADASLDVQERFLTVKSEKPARYLLELPLPYPVNADQGNARFHPKYKRLIVTLPVIRTPVPIMDTREDSGVDSDQSSPVPLPLDDPVTDSNPTHHHHCEPMPKLVEECELALAGAVLDDKRETIEEECRETALRASNPGITEEEFLSSSIKYTLPPFTCNIYDNQLAVTINVKNVDPSSIRRRTLSRDRGLHVSLASIGAGFFPQYYSLCLRMGENSVDPDSLTVEPWDNNVICTIGLRNTENLSHYYVGRNDEFMEERDLPTSASFKNQLKELTVTEGTEHEKSCKVEVQAEDNGVIVNIHSSQLESDDETDQQQQRVRRQNRRHVLTKSRSVSESSGDELTSSVGSTKGILKSRRTNFSRSMSESSADENGILISSADYHYDSVHDVNSESDCCSLKKTVRFNDVVSRQLFRSNSSILGQRKKNQRKIRNKKRAMERRMSESENSETEDRDKYKAKETEQEIQENVKPILQRDKQSKQQSRSIEIGKARNKSSQHKRKSSIQEEPSNDLHSACPTDVVTKDPAKTEFKNDLIFDLDM